MLDANEFEIQEILELFRNRQYKKDGHEDRLYPELRKAISRLVEMYESSGPVKFNAMIPHKHHFLY